MATHRGEDFAALIYKVLVVEKKLTLEQAADRLGMKYSTLYARVNARVPFSAEEINLLIKFVDDKRLCDWLLRGTGFIAVERNDEIDDDDLHESVRSGATASLLEASDVLREVELGLADHKIDHRDKIRIEAEIDDAERALAALREKMKEF